MKIKILALKAVAFVLSVAPLGVFLGINHKAYFTSSGQSFSLGVLICGLFALISLKDKLARFLKNNAQLKVSVFLLFLFWALGEISTELVIFSSLSAVGAILAIVPSHFAKKLELTKLQEKQGEVTAEAISKALLTSGVEITKK